MMIAAALVSSLVAVVDVRADADCLSVPALESALAEVGGVDVAELVRVSVEPGALPDERGRPRSTASIEIALINAPPILRALSIRPLECRDLPELVALLVAEQRAHAASLPVAPLPPPPPERPRAPRATQRYASPGCADVFCVGPPDWGGTAVSAFLGPVAALGGRGPRFGARVGASIALGIDQGFAVVASVEGGLLNHVHDGQGSMALHLGPEWRWHVDELVLAVRPSLGVGGAVVSGHGYDLLATPAVAGRLRFGWVFFEGGAFAQATTRWTPLAGVYAAAGLHL